MNEFFIGLFVSLLIGFVAGVERQMSSNYTKKDIGARDLLIISLMGFLSTNVLEGSYTMIFVFIAVLSLMGFWLYNTHHSKGKVGGFTTFLTLPTVFLLSSLTGMDVPIWQVLVFFGILILTLKLKDEWQAFIDTLKDREIVDFILFVLVLFVVTPLIPQELTWNLGFYELSAYFVWKIVSIISILSFFAHFFTKYLKGQRAVLLTSFLGGLVSSLGTIYLITKGKSKVSHDNAFAVFVTSGIGSIVRDVVIIYFLVENEFFVKLLLPFVFSEFLLVSLLFFSMEGVESKKIKFIERAMPVKTILEFVIAFVVIILISGMINFYLPEGYLYLSSFVSGVISSSAAVVASGDLFVQDLISFDVLGWSFAAAVFGSLFVRTVLMVKNFPGKLMKNIMPILLVGIAMSVGMLLALA